MLFSGLGISIKYQRRLLTNQRFMLLFLIQESKLPHVKESVKSDNDHDIGNGNDLLKEVDLTKKPQKDPSNRKLCTRNINASLR